LFIYKEGWVFSKNKEKLYVFLYRKLEKTREEKMSFRSICKLGPLFSN
jgi:hypothetical protein